MHDTHPTRIEDLSGERHPIWALLAGNLVSGLGNTFSMLAIPWFVLATGGSASQTALTVAVGTIPYVLVGIFGGAIVDRVGPKRAAIVSDLFSGGSTALIPLLHATIGLTFWQLLVLVFLGAFLDGPGSTARQALYPDLIHRAGMDVERANTWFTLTNRIAGVLGAPLAGVLIAATGATTLLWLNAASFAVAAAITMVAIPDLRTAPLGSSDPEAASSPFRAYLRDVRDGFHVLMGNRLLLALMASMTLGTLLAEPIYGVILPVYANEILGSAAQLGFIFGALGAGSIVGNVLYLALVNRLSRGTILIGGFAIRAVCFAIFLTMPPWWAIAIAIFFGAVALEPCNPMVMSIFQEQVPAGMRGRVFGAQRAVAACAFPVGLMLYGGLLSGIGVERTLVIFVALNALVPLAMILQPALRSITKPLPARVVAAPITD
ncbi:MAG: MFS transporter [Thermomicrobiales bacterium]